MKITNGRISILVNDNRTTIEIEDADASCIFVSVTLTNDQLAMALSRLACTPCSVEVSHLERVGKKMEWKSMEFEIPKETSFYHKKTELLELAKKALPEGWVGEYSFNSQNSFFTHNDKRYARCTIRRWVENI
jgi:hypothetical protein